MMVLSGLISKHQKVGKYSMLFAQHVNCPTFFNFRETIFYLSKQKKDIFSLLELSR